MTLRKKPRHPIFFYLMKNMWKHDNSYHFTPKDDETLEHALYQIKQERVRWTPTRKTILRNKLIEA